MPVPMLTTLARITDHRSPIPDTSQLTTGSLSPPWASAAVRAVAEAVADGEWRVLEGQAHNIAPDVLAAVLRERFA